MTVMNSRPAKPRRAPLLLAAFAALGHFDAATAQETATAPETATVRQTDAQANLRATAEALLETGNAPLDPAMLAAVTETTGNGFLPAAVTAGEIDRNGKVPALNAVPGSAVSNLDIAVPQTVLTHGQSYCFTVALQDFNVTGEYEVDYFIVQTVNGKTTVVQYDLMVSGKQSAPGDMWVWDVFGKALPDSPGPATLVGRVRWGTNYDMQAIVASKVQIQ